MSWPAHFPIPISFENLDPTQHYEATISVTKNSKHVMIEPCTMDIIFNAPLIIETLVDRVAQLRKEVSWLKQVVANFSTVDVEKTDSAHSATTHMDSTSISMPSTTITPITPSTSSTTSSTTNSATDEQTSEPVTTATTITKSTPIQNTSIVTTTAKSSVNEEESTELPTSMLGMCACMVSFPKAMITVYQESQRYRCGGS